MYCSRNSAPVACGCAAGAEASRAGVSTRVLVFCRKAGGLRVSLGFTDLLSQEMARLDLSPLLQMSSYVLLTALQRRAHRPKEPFHGCLVSTGMIQERCERIARTLHVC